MKSSDAQQNQGIMIVRLHLLVVPMVHMLVVPMVHLLVVPMVHMPVVPMVHMLVMHHRMLGRHCVTSDSCFVRPH